MKNIDKITTCILSGLFALQGCTAIDLTRFKANASGKTSACLSFASDVPTASPSPPPPGGRPGAAPVQRTRIYGPLLLPHIVSLPASAPPGAGDFAGYVTRSQSALAKLPGTVAQDEVTQALFKNLVKASALAQLEGATGAIRLPGAAPSPDPQLQKWTDAVNEYSPPNKITWGQLARFADKVLDAGLLPTLSDPNTTPGGAAPAQSAFEIYFRAYYEGTFVDRFGKSIQKPQLPNLKSNLANLTPVSLTITDAEISAAETVMLEYLFDLIDPTPVLGDAADANSVTAATKFYPGGTAQSKPTVFGTDLMHYMQIPSSGCGVTTKNIDVLTDISNAAGDRAAAIGGLSFNSFGGIGFSLGFLGKVSIGDNQTLSTMAKEAVQRFAMRVAYASGFWLIRDVASSPALVPGAQPPPPPSYLTFE